MKYFIITISLLLLCSQSTTAKVKRRESEYRDEWCAQYQGEAEVELEGGTRCDCIAEIDGITYAIELDRGKKVLEGIGQALFYALQTGHTPGVVLILEDEKDYKYWLVLNSVIGYHKLKIRTWIIKNYD